MTSAYLVIDLLTKDPTVDPEVDSCPSTTLLKKVMEAVPFTQELDKVHAYLNPW